MNPFAFLLAAMPMWLPFIHIMLIPVVPVPVPVVVPVPVHVEPAMPIIHWEVKRT